MEPFEDNLEDIIGKAQRALELTDPAFAELLGVERKRLRAARRGEFDRELIAALAPHLRLCKNALLKRLGGLKPPAPDLGPHLRQVVSTWGDMRVNAWLLRGRKGQGALLFDTGAEAEPLDAALDEMGVKPDKLVLTHTHGDHVALLSGLRLAFPAMELHAPEKEPIEGAEPVRDGDVLRGCGWTLRAIATPGHSVGGMSYAIYPNESSEDQPYAILVGDALFAGSVGGIRASLPGLTLRETYEQALECIRTRLLSFSAETLVLPGHGPATSVGWERENNPFFGDLID